MFLHIGLPKTGTTYLQEVVWSNRDRLRSDGVFLPGFGHREHLWAALDLQERPRLARRHEKAPGAWQRLVSEAAAQSGDVLITHEFFCGASAEQASRAIAAFPDAEVHLVVTARDAASVVSAGWQESVKNGSTVDLDSVMAGKPAGGPEFSMRTWDLAGVLERWTPDVPGERVHVLMMPGRGQPHDLHWQHFAEVIGVDPTAYDVPTRRGEPGAGHRADRAAAPGQRPPPGVLALRAWGLDPRLPRRGPARRPAAGARGPAGALHGTVRRARPGRRRAHRASAASTSSATWPASAPGEAPPGAREPGSVTHEELLESACRLVADIVADVRASTGDVPPRFRGSL